jgi:hypothetical protein
MSRALAYGFGLGLVLLTAAPGFDDPSADSYPLSTYPMFARAREHPQLSFAEGVDAAAAPVRLAPALIGSDEVMQAAATIRRAVQAGPTALEPLCAHIAARVAASPREAHVRAVRIVRARFDPVAYFVAGPVPEEREVLTHCAVTRTSP